ncbi:MAG: fatty acid desaturase [Deltaproteobacteria bacterium]|nr:fatty acid desaturase [Deltaproteobacteria bacterium]
MRPPPIPAQLNALLSLALLALMPAAQALAARASSPLGWGLWALCFGALMMPLNGLIHEAEHRMLHPRPVVNELLGAALSALFPSALSFTRHTHLGHHKRNRSDDELFDQYYPHERRWRKALSFYSLYLGLFWLVVPLGCLAVACVPRGAWRRLGGRAGRAMVEGLPARLLGRVRLECALGGAAQWALCWGLGGSLGSWLGVYAVAGVVWSSQQGLVHAGTRRHVVEGARDLRLPRAVEGLFLSWNLHLTHHRHPRVPWVHLSSLSAPEGRAPYVLTAARFWRGPTPCGEPPPGGGGGEG